MSAHETDEILCDLERRRQRNAHRKRRDIEIETAVRKLNVDWSLFQMEIAELGGDCDGDLRACRRILLDMGLSRSETRLVLRYLALQGGHCDCEVFFNVDMTKPHPLVEFDCIDCGGDFDEFDYVVEDAVWAAGGLAPTGGLLCIGCLERRLGRRLTRDDFKSSVHLDCPDIGSIGDRQSLRSLRLRDRLGGGPRP
jgi:hypothetical protein